MSRAYPKNRWECLLAAPLALLPPFSWPQAGRGVRSDLMQWTRERSTRLRIGSGRQAPALHQPPADAGGDI